MSICSLKLLRDQQQNNQQKFSGHAFVSMPTFVLSGWSQGHFYDKIRGKVFCGFITGFLDCARNDKMSVRNDKIGVRYDKEFVIPTEVEGSGF